jgi:hypothetical protein
MKRKGDLQNYIQELGGSLLRFLEGNENANCSG